MGGRGSGGGRGYTLPLQLTTEMKKSLDRLKVQLDDANDFPIALRIFRAGLIVYGVLDEQDMQTMYIRGKITDDEVQFLIEAGLCKDFRPVRVEALRDAEELNRMNKMFGDVVEARLSPLGLNEASWMDWVERAKKYPTLPNAVKLLELVKAVERPREAWK